MSEASDEGVESAGAAGGVLFVVATPIGNLEDLSPRARRVLSEADLLVCEDTRRTAALCARFGISTRRTALHAHNERRRLPGMLERLAAGERLALVSDAGTPLLSDPGMHLVGAAIAEGYSVVPIPGASAILAALVASGLPLRPFSFVGFLPRKGRERRTWLSRIAELPGSVVLFEAPGRVLQTLDELHGCLGPRRVAIARELTKRFEEVVRGRLGELELCEPRGEVTLVIEGVSWDRDVELADDEAIASWVLRNRRDNVTTRDLSRELAERSALSRSDAYRRVHELLARADGSPSSEGEG